MTEATRQLNLDLCVSGRAREAGHAVAGTGFAGVRGHARSHRSCSEAWRTQCLVSLSR